MNKIITAIDGLKYSESCTKYAIEFAKETNAHLVGAFLEDFTYHSYKIYDLVGKEGVDEERMKILEHKDVYAREFSIRQFEQACREASLNYSIHRDGNIAIRELLHESVYADLVVIDRKETLTHYEEKIPTRFIRDLLTNIQCPAVVVPDRYKPIEKIVLLYDGDPTSVYAVKMFSYLLPCFRETETGILSIRADNETLHMPDNKLIREFMKRHYPKAVYTAIKGTPEIEIPRYLREQPNVLVVLGAYQRGMVSRWFRPSMADILMRQLNVPLFIAHSK